MCGSLCFRIWGALTLLPWGPELADDLDPSGLGFQLKCRWRHLPLPCCLHRPQNGTDPKARLSSSLPICLVPAKQGLNNSWPMHTAQAWSGVLVAKLEGVEAGAAGPGRRFKRAANSRKSKQVLMNYSARQLPMQPGVATADNGLRPDVTTHQGQPECWPGQAGHGPEGKRGTWNEAQPSLHPGA